jgi:hypothetical protein
MDFNKINLMSSAEYKELWDLLKGLIRGIPATMLL